MAFRSHRRSPFAARLPACLLAGGLACGLSGAARAQVFVVGEKTAMAGVSTEFHPTRIELPSAPITERGRRDLVRNLEAEQGFAHRALPLGEDLILVANGNLTPSGDAYKEMLYKKGQSAAPGDRVVLTAVTVKDDRIVFDLNGGPYLNHRFLRHIDLNDVPIVPQDGAQVTGCRVTLLFEGGLPEVSAPEVKALLDPIIDFGVKTSAEAYADSLPPFLKDAVAHHDVLVGMDRKMVLAAMGEPQSKVRELVPGSTTRRYEEWIYGQMPQTVRFVRFEGDRVTAIAHRRAGQAYRDSRPERDARLSRSGGHTRDCHGRRETGQRRGWQRQAADDPEAGRGRSGQPEARAAAGPRINTCAHARFHLDAGQERARNPSAAPATNQQIRQPINPPRRPPREGIHKSSRFPQRLKPHWK